jgi:hypothetical protein
LTTYALADRILDAPELVMFYPEMSKEIVAQFRSPKPNPRNGYVPFHVEMRTETEQEEAGTLPRFTPILIDDINSVFSDVSVLTPGSDIHDLGNSNSYDATDSFNGFDNFTDNQ